MHVYGDDEMNKRRELVTLLTQAMLKAVQNDDECKAIVHEMMNTENMASEYALFSFQARLNDFINKKGHGPCDRYVPDRQQLEDRAIIDGKQLTSNEIAFEEHCSDKFDEVGWLDSLKLTPPEGKTNAS